MFNIQFNILKKKLFIKLEKLNINIKYKIFYKFLQIFNLDINII